jgi:hypothetical protein
VASSTLSSSIITSRPRLIQRGFDAAPRIQWLDRSPDSVDADRRGSSRTQAAGGRGRPGCRRPKSSDAARGASSR